MSNPRDAAVRLRAVDADKFATDVEQARVKFANFVNTVAALEPQIKRSRLALADQASALGVLADRVSVADSALEKFADTANKKTAGAAVSAVNALGKAVGDIGRATAASAQEPTARSTQGILDAQIALARTQQDYAKALELVAQARRSAAGDEERIAELDVQAIQIQRQQAKALGETKDAVTGLTDAERQRMTNLAALGAAQRKQAEDEALAQSVALGKAREAAKGNVPIAVGDITSSKQASGSVIANLTASATAVDKMSSAVDKLVLKINASGKTDEQKAALVAKLTEALNAQTKAYEELVAAAASGDQARIATATGNLTTASKGAAQATADVAAQLRKSSPEAQRLGDHFTSISSSIGASRVGVGLFTRELVQMAGGSTVAVQALDSFVYSTGTLGLALGAVTAGLILIRSANEAVTQSLKEQQTEIGNTERDYASLYNRLQQSQRSGIGLVSLAATVKDSAVEAAVGAYGQQLGNSWGRAFTDAASGDISGALNAFFSNLDFSRSWASIGENAAHAFIEGFKRRQEENATQLFVQGAQTRANAAALGTEIGNLQLEGKTYDELIPKVYEYLQAKKAIGEAQGSGVGGAITGTDIEGFLQSNFPSQALAQKATALAKSLRDIQSQYNEDSAQLAADHGTRILEIESSGWQQQVRLAREYSQRKKEIQDQYNQDTADAYSDYRQRIADAETNAQESRTKIAADYADRRAKIEQDYQDRVAQIQSDYQLALFDIVAKDDAKGLVRARLQRDKQLADAARTRDRENADAEKARAKQEKDLADSLAKQKRQLEQDYERRVRDLKQAFDKQNATADQNYRDSLADLQANIASQYAAENAGYVKRQAALETAKQKRIDAIAEELFTTKALYEKYGQAIIDSLKNVLDPATIIDLVNGLQQALDTKIEIKITPNVGTGGASAGKQEKTYAEGGYIDYTQRALIHAGETVLPAQNAQRAYDLASQHLSRVSMPLSGRYMQSNSTSGSIKLYIDNSINSALLSSQIRAESTGIVVDIVKRARS